MPTPTYIPLATITIPSNTTTVTFASIPSSVDGVTLRDLVLIGDFTATGACAFIMRVGSGTIDTGGNYSNVAIYGDGTNTGSSAVSGQGWFNTGFTNETKKSVWKLQFLDFSATDKHKTVLMDYRTAASAFAAWTSAGRWGNNSAINTIRLQTNSAGQSFASGSTFSLYGIAS
jgi:hypothetical protein